MPEWIDFDYRNSEFTDRDGNVLGAGWLDIEFGGDGERFEIESVRYVVTDFALGGRGAEKLRKTPAHISDFIADWLLTPAGQAAARAAYEARIEERADPGNRADDRGCFEYHQMRGAA